MKKIFNLALLLLATLAINAQSTKQGTEHLYYERGRSAGNVFHQIIKQDPVNGEAWYYLTKAYALQDKVNKASDTILRATSAAWLEPYFKVAYGYILLQQSRPSEATNNFNAALEATREKNAGILAAVANAHLEAKEGDVNYAIELLNKAIKRDKNNEALYVELGDAYRKLGKGSEAFEMYQKALEKNEKYALAYHRMGKIFLTQNNPSVYLDYFKKAIAADPKYAPSLYMLYAYEFNHDPAKSMEYYREYLANTDKTDNNDYELADLLYQNKQYHEAIQKAHSIVSDQGDNAKARIYKLSGYSYAALKDTTKALASMEEYFEKEQPANFVPEDFVTMANLYAATPGQDSLTVVYLEKASAIEKDSAALFAYYKRLSDVAKEKKDYAAQAKWLSKYYPGNNKATNLDLFNWGLGHYLAGEYPQADTVFQMYATMYPEQSFGYYWQAKSKAMQDTTMELGLAVPVYQKLIEVLANDTANANYKKWLVTAYEYLAAYEANVKKDYAASIAYFKKVLEVEPDNESAEKYIKIFEKNMAIRKAS